MGAGTDPVSAGAFPAELVPLLLGRGPGKALHPCRRVKAILRRLHRDAVAHAAARVEIEAWRRLEAATERNEEALGHIALREADCLGTCAIHVHREVGAVERLLNARIRSAGYITNLVQ